MPVIKDLIEAAAVKIAGFRRCRLGSHRKTPAFGGPAPRSRHFTMLREDQESRSLNDLWVVQGRLATGHGTALLGDHGSEVVVLGHFGPALQEQSVHVLRDGFVGVLVDPGVVALTR